MFRFILWVKEVKMTCHLKVFSVCPCLLSCLVLCNTVNAIHIVNKHDMPLFWNTIVSHLFFLYLVGCCYRPSPCGTLQEHKRHLLFILGYRSSVRLTFASLVIGFANVLLRLHPCVSAVNMIQS